MNWYRIKQEWFSNMRGDALSGLVVALALIPEAIAFSIIVGVDPKVGLYASFAIAVVIAFTGGRPGMISAATAATALLMITLVKDHGLEYLLAASILAGVLQIAAGYIRLDRLMRFISNSVMTGFVNALAILIFMAQLPELTNVTWHVYAMTAAGLAIIYGLPKITNVIPSPLVTIVVLTLIAWLMNIDVRTVGDMGEMPDTLPVFLFPDIPLNLETLMIILPYSAAIAVVGLLESLMTQNLLDTLTDTKTSKARECKGQGIANIVSGSMGGMAGCAMVGQSVINIKSGGRGRLSTFLAGIYLLILVVFLAPVLTLIPMAALVAVMIMVSIGTFSWGSIRDLKKHPMSTNVVMLMTVIVTVATHNLAYGVLTGVLLAAMFFANKVGQFMHVSSRLSEDENDPRHRTYEVAGQVFFASTEKFLESFDFKDDVDKVSIDLSKAHFWDITAVHALDKVVVDFRREGIEVEVIGMNQATATIVDKHGVHNDPDAAEKLMGH
ncbi:SulP family inorganic anion transporter [Guyparkeria sp. SCN-R1]|uniref:SulP family inorganic anion transporter n=1 Tax=Guyparkeria sp. SCN-R1 TaxID=2341113 RepID=UPI000F64FD09|nr:SulP family inorganic anion transporter [Guyparkeria sp. SCN-R1]RRQ24591.1 SulP family inorganic anion transporter [Guyparkeria sp. SCN-R1]